MKLEASRTKNVGERNYHRLLFRSCQDIFRRLQSYTASLTFPLFTFMLAKHTTSQWFCQTFEIRQSVTDWRSKTHRHPVRVCLCAKESVRFMTVVHPRLWFTFGVNIFFNAYFTPIISYFNLISCSVHIVSTALIITPVSVRIRG